MTAAAASSSVTETPALAPDTCMKDVLVAFPGARRALFARYHIGGCQSCAFQPEETLAEVCARNENIPVDEVIAHIQDTHDADAKILVEPTELAAEIKGEEGKAAPVLLDIRTREEFEAVSLSGAKLFSNDLLNEIFTSWDKETPLVVYDHTGGRSLDAAAYLIGHGFNSVRALRGGIDAYSQEADASIPRYRIEYEEE